MARPRAGWQTLLPRTRVHGSRTHTSMPTLAWMPPTFRWLTRHAVLQALPPTTFTRYWQPFQPPSEADDGELTSSFLTALEKQDIPACLAMLRTHTPTYPLWLSLWTLVAEGPNPIPASGLYDRLDMVCVHLCELYYFHRSAYPTRSIPPQMRQRLVYLLLKRAERIDATFVADARTRQQRAQASILLDVAGDLHTLDGELAGRLVFRLARMQALDVLGPCLTAYMTHEAPPQDVVSAAQPLAAILDEALAWHERTGQEAALTLGIEAIRLAFLRSWPIKHTLVQRWLRQAGPTLTRLCLAPPSTPRLPLAYTACPLDVLVRDVHALQPQYMHERAAVVLCRMNDARAALKLVEMRRPSIPFDVYAAAISALTWMVRTHISPRAALSLALRTFEALYEAGMHADEQMYGELVRAFESRLHSSPSETCAWVEELADDDIPWTTLLASWTRHMIAHHDVPLVRADHLGRLLRLHIRCRQGWQSRQLYEQMREHHALMLPCMSPAQFGWLFMQSYSRPTSLSFAMRLYQDWCASGCALPQAHIEPYLRSLLAYGMASMVHRVVCDQRAYVPLPTLASYVLRAHLTHGYYEAAFAWASDLLHTPEEVAHWVDTSHPPVPSLMYYALCFYETSQYPQYALDEQARRRLDALFDEFQLGLAHAIASSSVCMDTISQAYYGMLRVTMQVLGPDSSSAERLPLPDRQAAWDRFHTLWYEWQDLNRSLGPTATSLQGDLDALYARIQHVPRPSAVHIDGVQYDG